MRNGSGTLGVKMLKENECFNKALCRGAIIRFRHGGDCLLDKCGTHPGPFKSLGFSKLNWGRHM